MTPSFTKGNKQLIIANHKFIRIYHTPERKIDGAVDIVRSALDRKLPFAYKTVKPMYYLEKIAEYCNREGDRVYQYTHHVSMDNITKARMASNYYKLKKALLLLHDEGYVKTYWVLADNPSFRVSWWQDHPAKRMEHIEEIDYGAFPPDYEPAPRRPKFKVRHKMYMERKMFEGAVIAMRKAFPLTDVKQGKIQPMDNYIGPAYKVTPDDPGYTYNGMWNMRDMMNREMEYQNQRNFNEYRRTDEYHHEVLLTFLTTVLYWRTVGREVNTYV